MNPAPDPSAGHAAARTNPDPDSTELLARTYDELRALAAHALRQERPGHTLQPTALVHEAWLSLARGGVLGGASRARFFALAATAMRHVLVNHALEKGRAKRGGGWHRVPLEETDDPGHVMLPLDVVALDQALAKLAGLDPRKAHLVELRFFAGLTLDEAAGMLGVSRTTAADDWRVTKAWLRRELREMP